jgi:hypothetical protein
VRGRKKELADALAGLTQWVEGLKGIETTDFKYGEYAATKAAREKEELLEAERLHR